MKTKLFTLIFGVILFVSCQQKEMKISRSDFSVVTEMTDFSPAYISKNDKGKVEINKNNLIGNTHWVLSVDRDLTMNEVAPFLHDLTEKKHKVGGMHEDTKDIYFVYSDTVHKQNAYVKLPFSSIDIDIPPIPVRNNKIFSVHSIEDLTYFKEILPKIHEHMSKDQTLSLGFKGEISVEEFVSILIEIEKEKLSSIIYPATSVYKNLK